MGTSLTYTLAGAHFMQGATTISVAGTGVTVENVNVLSAASLTVRLTIDSAAMPGSRLLTVQTPGGSAAGTLNVVAQPAISSLNPASAVQNATISSFTVAGSGFDLFASPAIAFVPAGGSGADSKFQVTNVSLVNASTIRFSLQIGSASNLAAAGDYHIEIRDNLASPQIRTQNTGIMGTNILTVTAPVQTVSVSSPILRVNFGQAPASMGAYSAVSDVLRVTNPSGMALSTVVSSPVLRVDNPNLAAQDQLIASSPIVAGCFPAIALGTNLIVNGDAEPGSSATTATSIARPICWTTTGSFTSVQYGVSGFLSSSSGAGANFFAGGPNSGASTASQSIDVSSLASSIDGGNVKATLSALLGGSDSQADNMTVSVTFKSSSADLGSLSIGPVSASDRSSVTSLVSRSGIGAVPQQTRVVVVTVTATRSSGTYNDGYADNISFSLNY